MQEEHDTQQHWSLNLRYQPPDDPWHDTDDLSNTLLCVNVIANAEGVYLSPRTARERLSENEGAEPGRATEGDNTFSTVTVTVTL